MYIHSVGVLFWTYFEPFPWSKADTSFSILESTCVGITLFNFGCFNSGFPLWRQWNCLDGMSCFALYIMCRTRQLGIHAGNNWTQYYLSIVGSRLSGQQCSSTMSDERALLLRSDWSINNVGRTLLLGLPQKQNGRPIGYTTLLSLISPLKRGVQHIWKLIYGLLTMAMLVEL